MMTVLHPSLEDNREFLEETEFCGEKKLNRSMFL